MDPWRQLLDVQALDTALTQLEHRRAQLPARSELAEIEDQLVAARAETSAAESERHELARAQQRIEDEIAIIQDKIDHAETQLYGGGSSDSKQLQALQDEIAGFKRRISALEDDEIELMEQMEPIDARLDAIEQRRTTLDERATELTKVLAEQESTIEAERAELVADRADAVAEVDPEALSEYERVRARLGGVAVARLDQGVCGACHIKLSAVERDRIQHLAPDEPVTCEDCGRFLVRS